MCVGLDYVLSFYLMLFVMTVYSNLEKKEFAANWGKKVDSLHTFTKSIPYRFSDNFFFGSEPKQNTLLCLVIRKVLLDLQTSEKELSVYYVCLESGKNSALWEITRHGAQCKLPQRIHAWLETIKHWV